MKRREFITLLGGAQQPAVPVIGLLGSTSPETYSNFLTAFRKGLDDAGFVEPQKCRIEFRWARDQTDLLPALATELVNQKPAVIMTAGGLSPALAAQAATSTIPVVFAAVSDPVGVGLVASLNRPGGNITGVDALLGETNAKRLELLRELVPHAEVIGVLANPSRADTSTQIDDIEAVAAKLGQKILVQRAGTASDIDVAIAKLIQQGVGALLISADPLFASQRDKLVALTAQNSLPSSFNIREFAVAGGLMSYGTRLAESYRQAGLYVGRIIKGEKPADLPVVQPTKFDLVINLKTAKALGLTVPQTLLATADEVIE